MSEDCEICGRERCECECDGTTYMLSDLNYNIKSLNENVVKLIELLEKRGLKDED